MTKQVLNPSSGNTVTLLQIQCPRCHGHGLTTDDEDPSDCICNGTGIVWHNSYSGLIMAYYGRKVFFW